MWPVSRLMTIGAVGDDRVRPPENHEIAWCPKCEQECVPMRNGTCGFCDTAVEALKAKPAPVVVAPRRRRGKPRLISDVELRKLHVLHTQAKRLSVMELSRRIYARFGYSSPAQFHHG